MNGSHVGVGVGSLFSAVSIAHILAYYQGVTAPVNDEAAVIMGILVTLAYVFVTFRNPPAVAAPAPGSAPPA